MLRRDINQLPRRETFKERAQFHWVGLRIPVLKVETLFPFLIDRLWGHIWGSIAAGASIIGWLYFGLKAHLAPATRLIWLLGFALVLIVAAVEFAHFFGLQLSSK